VGAHNNSLDTAKILAAIFKVYAESWSSKKPLETAESDTVFFMMPNQWCQSKKCNTAD